MIIDSKKYTGRCSCGHEHKMTTEFCVIEAGGLENIDKYIEKFGVKSTLGDIDVPEEKIDILMEYSPLVRNRLTLMRLRRAIIGRGNK